jgi:DNA-binding transcriptional regulator GbsR (MarR family)
MIKSIKKEVEKLPKDANSLSFWMTLDELSEESKNSAEEWSKQIKALERNLSKLVVKDVWNESNIKSMRRKLHLSLKSLAAINDLLPQLEQIRQKIIRVKHC